MIPRARRALVIAFGLALAAPAWTAGDQQSERAAATVGRAKVVAAVVEQPRPFGYVVGDLFTQRVLLEAEGQAVRSPQSPGGSEERSLVQAARRLRASRRVEPAQLPALGRVGIWFERRSARIDRGPDGRRWLSVEYQVINAPQSLRTIRLPAWEIKTKSPGPTLRVAEWSLSVGPLTRSASDSVPAGTPSSGGEPSSGSESATGGEAASGGGSARVGDSASGAEPAPAVDHVLLRPDRAAPLVPTASIRRSLLVWSSALGVTLIAWLAWLLWRNHAEAARLPFARALREMRHADGSAPETWQALHRAFDDTAGRVVQRESLAVLFERAPYFSPLRASIETFFAQSSERFFGGGLPAQPISARALCRDLRRLEKRNVR